MSKDTMNAVYYKEFGGAEVLQLGELPVPLFTADEVLVQVAAAGINPIDRRLRAGELQEHFQRQWPITPGWDVSGRVVAVGKNVIDWKEGDDIVGLACTPLLHHGSYAEYLPIKASALAHKPEHIPFTDAAALPLVSLTAWESLAEYAKLKAGDSVLIQAGAGGLGSVAIPIAKHLGAKVYSTARKINHDYVKSRGAAHVIDYTDTDYFRYIKKYEPAGINAVLESLTDETIINNAIRLVKPGGTVAYMNNEPPNLPEIQKNNIRTKFLHHSPNGKSLGKLMTLYAEGKIPLPKITVMDLENAQAAHEKSESTRTQGKIVLRIQDLKN
jgi:NADPH:quinone reductase-like Zn-dependent oxidoreductase